jgi:ADP-ribose pyrophosphatase YjhB (NUDIX family)
MFNFCPVCGGTLTEMQLPTEDRPRLVCTACGHISYINPKIVSGTLPVQDGKVWLLRRGIEPRYGYWTYPAGYQEIDETTESAAKRETWEELGVLVETTGLFGVYSRAGNHVVNVVYLARLLEDSAVPMLTSEAIEVGLFGTDEIPWEELAFPSTHQVLQQWVALESADRTDMEE